MSRRIHHQKRIKGVKREALPSCVLPSIYNAVDNIARQFGVSRSWVTATLLAKELRIKEQESFYNSEDVRTNLRRVK